MGWQSWTWLSDFHWPLAGPSCKWNHNLCFCDWLVSLSIMSFKIHPYCSLWQNFLLFKAEYYSIVWTDHILFISLSFFFINLSNLSCFLLLFMVNNAAMNMDVQMLVSYIPWSGIAMVYGNSLTFSRTTTPFSPLIAPFYISTSNGQAFQFLYSLSTLIFFFKNKWQS